MNFRPLRIGELVNVFTRGVSVVVTVLSSVGDIVVRVGSNYYVCQDLYLEAAIEQHPRTSNLNMIILDIQTGLFRRVLALRASL